MDKLEMKVRLLELSAAVHGRRHENQPDTIAKTAMAWYNDVSKWDSADTPQVPQPAQKTLTLPKK